MLRDLGRVGASIQRAEQHLQVPENLGGQPQLKISKLPHVRPEPEFPGPQAVPELEPLLHDALGGSLVYVLALMASSLQPANRDSAIATPFGPPAIPPAEY
jgi:hypothetical protein